MRQIQLRNRIAEAWTTVVSTIALACLLLSSPVGKAQSSYGSLIGTASDSTGAVVTGVQVTLQNSSTNEKRSVSADERGNYQFANLLPGVYTLTFEHAGFKKLVREKVEVKTSTVSRIDAAMEVGGVETQVVVTAEAPALDTQSSTVGAVIEGKVVEQTPLNGRNVMNLIALAPGVVPQGSSSGSVQSNQHGGTFSNPAGWGNYQIGGGMAGQSAMWVDGQPLNGTQNNSPVIVPVQDIVQEFRVETNTVSPEFGRFAGGVVNMSTKQGSNKWHGAAYEYVRNKSFNANDFFSKRANQPRAQWTQNQFGALASGPIKRDKAFFFAAWESFRLRMQEPNTGIQVPSAAMKKGNFSESLGTSTGQKDPCGNLIYTGSIYDPLTSSPLGTCVFAGNVIPTNRLDNTGYYIINHYYETNNGAVVNGLWSGNGGSGSNYDQLTGRVDYNLGAKNRLFARYTDWRADTIDEDPFKNGYGKPGEKHQTHMAVLGDTYTLSEKTIADVRLSYSGLHWDSVPPSTGRDMTVYDTSINGTTGKTWTNLSKGLLSFNQNIAPFVPGGPIWGLFMDVTQVSYDNVLAATGSLTRIAGRHTFKFGGEWRYTNYSNISANNASGHFTFAPAPVYTHNGWSDLIMGLPVDGSTQTVRATGQQMFYGGLYAMDTFQVSRKLTLNFGVRWEQPGAFREHHDLNTVFLPDASDTTAVINGATVSHAGLLALVNSSDYKSRYDQELKWNLFVPRVGFAYRISDKMVVKGGFGMSFLPSNGQASSSPITGANNSITPGNVFPAIFGTPSHTWLQNAYSGGTSLVQPAGRAANYRTMAYGSSISVQVPYFSTPSATQWNLSLGQDFGKGMSLEAGYVGAKGTHLPNNGNGNINQLPSSSISSYKAACDGLSALCPLLTNGSVNAAGQLLFPYPQYVGVTQNRQYWGSSIYHGLQARYQKRFQQGSSAQVAYTWSKMISDVDSLYSFVEEATVGSGPQNQYDHRAERAISSFDASQRVQVSYYLALPFGRGQHMLNNSGALVNRLVAGWGLNGITTFQTGFPLAFQAQATTLSSNFNAGTPRPNITSGCNPSISGSAKSRLSKWFDTSCFTQPNNFSFGSAPRSQSNLRASGIHNWDLSVVKKTQIVEGHELEFRAEFFNIANHARFLAPNTTVGNSQFGQVTATANKPRLAQFALRYSF